MIGAWYPARGAACLDPAMALRNYAELLRPGGRLIAVNAWNLRDSAYTACSPSWYLDYFVDEFENVVAEDARALCRAVGEMLAV